MQVHFLHYHNRTPYFLTAGWTIKKNHGIADTKDSGVNTGGMPSQALRVQMVEDHYEYYVEVMKEAGVTGPPKLTIIQ